MGKTKTPVPHDVQGDVAETGINNILLQKIIDMKLQQDQTKVTRSRKRPTDDNFNLSGKKRVPRGPVSNLKVVTTPTKKPVKGDGSEIEKSPLKLEKPIVKQLEHEEFMEDMDVDVDDEEEAEEEAGEEEEGEEDPGELPEKAGQMSNDPGVRIRQCEVCFRIFSAVEKLRRHLRSHTQVAEAKCTLCNQNIKYSYNLKNHMQLCQSRLRANTEAETLRTRYPNFLAGIKACMRDPTIPMPELDEGTPFQIDRYGFVTGFDDTLEIDLDLLIPNYNPNKHLEVVPDEEPGSDDDYESDHEEGAGHSKDKAASEIEEDGEGDDEDDDEDLEGAESSMDVSQ